MDDRIGADGQQTLDDYLAEVGAILAKIPCSETADSQTLALPAMTRRRASVSRGVSAWLASAARAVKHRRSLQGEAR
jgi:hypothetical protein